MNNTPDLSPLIKGVLALVGISIALGQYPKMEHWARTQAIEAVAWKQGLPYFFAASHAGANHMTSRKEKRGKPSMKPHKVQDDEASPSPQISIQRSDHS